MEAGRCADVDDVDGVHGEQVIEVAYAALDLELVGEGVELFLVDVADRQEAEAIRVGQVAIDDVGAANAAADDGNVLEIRRHSSILGDGARQRGRDGSLVRIRQGTATDCARQHQSITKHHYFD